MKKETTPLLNAEHHSHDDAEAAMIDQEIMDPKIRQARRQLILACVCSIIFMITEVIGGYLAGSLAIMTDAAHLLCDVAAFLISLFAIWISTIPASSRMSYGFHRAEVLGAVLSVLLIWSLTGILVLSAWQRLLDDLSPNPRHNVNGKLMFIVAVVGIGVNLLLMSILGHHHHHVHGNGGHSHGEHSHEHDSEEESHDHHHHDHDHCHHHHEHENDNGFVHHESPHDHEEENINVRAAYIHALGDLAQSFGVSIAGAIIWIKPEWQIADPIATFLFSILVLATTTGILKQSVHLLMEGTPDGIDPVDIERGLCSLKSVESVHDLHIWSVKIGVPSLSVHVLSNEPDCVLQEAQKFLLTKGIRHSTIQVENIKTAADLPGACFRGACSNGTCSTINGVQRPMNQVQDVEMAAE